MSNVNAHSKELFELASEMKKAINNIESTRKLLVTKYEQLGLGWTDQKYAELGIVLQDALKSYTTVAKALNEGYKLVSLLAQNLYAYENTDLPNNKDMGLSEFATDVVREVQYSTSETVKVRLNRVGVKNVDFRGLPPNIQNEIATSFETMARLFPESVGTVSTICVSNSMEPSTPASTGFSIQSGYLETFMNINPSWFAARDLDDRINECSSAGQWAGNGIGGIINHEIGHAMHLQLDAEDLGMRLGSDEFNSLSLHQLSHRWRNNTTTNNIRDTVLNEMGLSRDDIFDSLSEYADTDGSECFAECVADITTSSNPNPISINIIREYSLRLASIRDGGYL